MSILVTDHCCIILWICLLLLSVCLTEVMHSRFIWTYHIIVYWQSLCVIEFIWLLVHITGHSKVILSDVVHWIRNWTSKLYIRTITDGSYWSVSFGSSKIHLEVIEITGWTLSSLVITGWTLSLFADWSYWSLSSCNKQDLYLENIQQHCVDKLFNSGDPDWRISLSGWTMFLNVSSRVNISSFWTNIISNQVIIGLLSFMLRRSLN